MRRPASPDSRRIIHLGIYASGAAVSCGTHALPDLLNNFKNGYECEGGAHEQELVRIAEECCEEGRKSWRKAETCADMLGNAEHPGKSWEVELEERAGANCWCKLL